MQTYWHFLPNDGRMRHTGERVEVGKTYRVTGRPLMCEHGLHASKRALDALAYAPGNVCCLVTLGGTVINGVDKSVATERTVLAMANVAAVLHEFACWCAEQALARVDRPDPRSVAAIATKRRWIRGEATTGDLIAAQNAVWDARTAITSSWSAEQVAELESAASVAWVAEAHTVAWVAARRAADAGGEYSWPADRHAQNVQLDAMLRAALGVSEDTP